MCVCVCRNSDIQYLATNRNFYTPGVVYRPATLKSITVLHGNTDKRKVFSNFELSNLHITYPDVSHEMYQRYLETNYFIPPGNDVENKFWPHLLSNSVPQDLPYATDTLKGLFNVFPLNLATEELAKNATSTNLGVISTSPLKIEIVFEPVTTVDWFLACTYCYTNRINFTGSKQRQDVSIEVLK